jgi:HEAT repeat protein
VSVKDDPQLSSERAKDLLEKLRRSNDTFVPFLIRKYPDPAVIVTLLKDLMSEDSQAVGRAAYALTRLRQLPNNAGTIVHKAMKKQLEIIGQQQNRDAGVLSSLAYLASNVGTDDALAAVLELVQSDLGQGTRASAMSALGLFKQAPAVQELRAFLKDPDEAVRFSAARALAKRQDADALPVLIQVARDSQSQWRPYALEELARYANNPEAESVLKEGGQAVGRPSFASWWNGFGGPGQLLLHAPGVKEELKLTKQQIKSITEIVAKARGDQRDRLSHVAGGALSAKGQALLEELHQEMLKALARVLTPEQEQRLWQINLQAFRTDALLLPDVQHNIGLRAEQEQKIKTIMENRRQEMNEILDGPQGYPEETRKRLDAAAKEATMRITAVLTEGQKKVFQEMTGTPFDFAAHQQKSSR